MYIYMYIYIYLHVYICFFFLFFFIFSVHGTISTMFFIVLKSQLRTGPPPTLSPTDPVPHGLLTAHAYTYI